MSATTATTMKAMQLSYKTAKATVIEVAKPEKILAHEVLLKVNHSAIDTALDACVQKTWVGSFTHVKTNPLILGWHFSGTVVDKGENVESLKLEDDVWGFLQYAPDQRQGTFAEYITVPADECAILPKGVASDVAAAASTESLTALQALKNLGGTKQNSSVLILGAGGGVGSAAVQIAKALGANVTAVVSKKDVDRVKLMGADVVLDRSKVNPLGGTTFDVIFDTPSQYSATRCMKHLRAKGTYVATIPSFGLLVGMCFGLFSGKGAKFIGCHSNREDLELVGKWLSEGKLKIDIDGTYPIKDLQTAMARQNARSKLGRVVMQVNGGWE